MLQIVIIIFLVYCAHIPFIWWYVMIGAGVLDAIRLCFMYHRPKVTVNIPEAHTGMNVPKSDDSGTTSLS
jgi:hypothetical protein